MSAIILLSLAVDSHTAQPAVDALVEHRLDVRWVQVEPANRKSVAAARAMATEAQAVVLLWSSKCAAPDAEPLRDIAGAAAQRGTLICVRVDSASLPDFLQRVSIYNLHGWRSHPSPIRRFFGGGLYLRDVVAAAQYKAAGRDPPPPSAPRNMLIRQLLFVAPAAFGVLFFLPTLIGLWNDLGMSNVPSAKEEAAWKSLDGSCSKLREFLTEYSNGHYAGQAQARLDGRKTMIERSWEPMERTMPAVVSLVDAPIAASEDAARIATAREAGEQANATCRRLAEAGSARLREARLSDGNYRCDPASGGVQCTFDGEAVCGLDEPRDTPVETCSQK